MRRTFRIEFAVRHPLHIRHRAGFILLACIVAAGCARATPPPPTSAAKFLAQAEGGAHITGAMGVAIEAAGTSSSDSDESASGTSVYIPATELSLARGEGFYRWSVTAGVFNLSYEGSLVPIDNSTFELGLLHGGSVGVASNVDNFGFYPGGGLGLFAGVGPERIFHAAVRYWLATYVPDGESGQDIVATIGLKVLDAVRFEAAVDHWWGGGGTNATYVIVGATFTGKML